MKKIEFLFLSQLSIGYCSSVGSTLILKGLIWTYFANKYDYFLALGLMFLSAIIIRYILVLLYDSIKIDFFAIEKYKANQKYKSNRITRKIDKIKKTSGKYGIGTGFATFDPAILVIYSRPGYFDWNGFGNNQVRLLFLLSNLIGVLIFGNIAELIF